jgi:hypothetical protein
MGRPLSLPGVWLSVLNLKEFRKHIQNVKKKSSIFTLFCAIISKSVRRTEKRIVQNTCLASLCILWICLKIRPALKIGSTTNFFRSFCKRFATRGLITTTVTCQPVLTSTTVTKRLLMSSATARYCSFHVTALPTSTLLLVEVNYLVRVRTR